MTEKMTYEDVLHTDLLSVDKRPDGDKASTNSRRNQDEGIEGRDVPLLARGDVIRDTLLGQNELPRDTLLGQNELPRDTLLGQNELPRDDLSLNLPWSFQIIAAEIWMDSPFEIMRTRRPSLYTTEVRRCRDVSIACERAPWSQRAICQLPANIEATIPRLVFQDISNSLTAVPEYISSKRGHSYDCKLNLTSVVAHQAIDKFHKYLPAFGKNTSLIHHRQGDVYFHLKSVLISFLYMLFKGSYYLETRIQTFRNHCLVDYITVFVPTIPAIFRLIFGSVIYTVRTSSLSFQVLQSLEFTDRSSDNWDTVNDDWNTDNDDDDNNKPIHDEIDDRDLVKHYTDARIRENKPSYVGQFSDSADKGVRMKVIAVYINMYLQNGFAKSDGHRKDSRSKKRRTTTYCDYKPDIQHSHTYSYNIQPTKSKRNGRVRVKATLSAASDPPPDSIDIG